MAFLLLNRIAWQYHSENGNTYRVSAEKALTDQAVLGGEAWDGVSGPKPASIKMRHITVSLLGVGSRTVPVYTNTAPILALNTVINANFNANSHAFLSSGNVIPENHIRTSVTRQAT